MMEKYIVEPVPKLFRRIKNDGVDKRTALSKN